MCVIVVGKNIYKKKKSDDYEDFNLKYITITRNVNKLTQHIYSNMRIPIDIHSHAYSQIHKAKHFMYLYILDSAKNENGSNDNAS